MRHLASHRPPVLSGFIFDISPKESWTMALEKEWIDRAEAICTAILQLQDSL